MKSSIIRINQLLLILLSALAIFTPCFYYKKMAIFLVLFILWLISSCTIDKNWLRTILKPIAILLGIVILDYILGLSHNDKEAMLLGINKMPTFVWIIFLFFYTCHEKLFSEVFPLLLVLIIISSFYTIKGNIEFPAASRLLAGTLDYYASLREEYHAMNIGGYDFIFALVFSIMPIGSLALRKSKITSIILFLIIAEMIITIVLGAFMIGILFSVIMLALVFIDLEEIKIANILIFSIVIFFCWFYLFDILSSVGNQYNINALIAHSEEIMDGSYSTVKEHDNNRFYLYWNAILNWLDSPIWGQLFGLVSQRRAGHSQMLDFLEKYGLFSVIYVSYFKSLYKHVACSFLSNKYFKTYRVYYIIMILFMFVDRFDTFTGIGFAVFFFAPMIFILSDTNYVNSHPEYCLG